MKNERKLPKAPTIPEKWVNLFLCVADFVDGGYDDADRSLVAQAYMELLGTDEGSHIYEEAVAGGTSLLESLEEDHS